MAEENAGDNRNPEDRWHYDPIKGLKSDDKDRWPGRRAMLEHLKAVYEELGEDDDPQDMVGNIEKALKRMEVGCYDICSACGKSIDEDVFRASSPWMTTCSFYFQTGQECERSGAMDSNVKTFKKS